MIKPDTLFPLGLVIRISDLSLSNNEDRRKKMVQINSVCVFWTPPLVNSICANSRTMFVGPSWKPSFDSNVQRRSCIPRWWSSHISVTQFMMLLRATYLLALLARSSRCYQEHAFGHR